MTDKIAFDNELQTGLVVALDLAGHVYELDKEKDKQQPPPEGWEVFQTHGMDLQFVDSALVDSAAVYINKTTFEACYVCRGSHTLVDWLVDDGAFVLPEFFLKFTTLSLIRRELPRVADAAKNINAMLDNPNLRDYKKFLVGHSLGGFVVKAACIYNGLKVPVVSFNGPGWFEFPIIGWEHANILEVTNTADIVGNYRNKAENELYVNTGDDLSKRDFWGTINPIVGTIEMGQHFAAAHQLDHIRKKLMAVVQSFADKDVSLQLFNGLYNDRLKQLFADRETYWGVRVADVDLTLPDGSAPLDNNTKVDQAIVDHNGRVALATAIQLFGSGCRQLQLRYNDGSGESIIGSYDADEGRVVTFPVTIGDLGKPVVGPGTFKDGTQRPVLLKSLSAPTSVIEPPDRDTAMNIREQLWLLHGANFDPLPQTFNAAFALLIQMQSNPDAIFFAKATHATGPEIGATLALMFGEWLDDPAALQAGDVVWFTSPFVTDGESWGILAERMTEGTHKVLFPNKKTYRGEYLRDVPVALVRGWRPNYKQAIDENSALGRFWGPLMSKLRGYIEANNGAIDEDALLRALALRTDASYGSIADFTRIHAQELKEVGDAKTLPFGSVVVTTDQKGIGVYLSNFRVLGVRRHGEAPGHWTLAQFGAGKYRVLA